MRSHSHLRDVIVDGVEEFLNLEGFANVIDGIHGGSKTGGGNDNDGNGGEGGVALLLPTKLLAVEYRHHHVEQDERRTSARAKKIESFLPIG